MEISLNAIFQVVYLHVVFPQDGEYPLEILNVIGHPGRLYQHDVHVDFNILEAESH